MSIISPLPNTLVNGTPMDAPQVMANFNEIYNDVNNNAAHSGVNGDITQLTNLSTPLSVSQGGTGLTSGLNLADGQVQVSVSASTVTVTPFDGGNLIINGVQRQLSAPFSVTPATAINTAYYVYAAMDVVPTATAEISTTVPLFDAFGRKNKTGDPTRRLVGMVRTDGAGNFGNTIALRGCLNYFNRRTQPLQAIGTIGTASTSLIQETGSLVTFLTWADDAVIVTGTGTMSNSTAGTNTSAQLAIDGAVVGQIVTALNPTANGGIPYGQTYAAFLSEGAHTSSIFVKVSSGAGGTFNIANYTFVRG